VEDSPGFYKDVVAGLGLNEYAGTFTDGTIIVLWLATVSSICRLSWRKLTRASFREVLGMTAFVEFASSGNLGKLGAHFSFIGLFVQACSQVPLRFSTLSTRGCRVGRPDA